MHLYSRPHHQFPGLFYLTHQTTNGKVMKTQIFINIVLLCVIFSAMCKRLAVFWNGEKDEKEHKSS